jgi:hypothetical protein
MAALARLLRPFNDYRRYLLTHIRITNIYPNTAATAEKNCLHKKVGLRGISPA